MLSVAGVHRECLVSGVKQALGPVDSSYQPVYIFTVVTCAWHCALHRGCTMCLSAHSGAHVLCRKHCSHALGQVSSLGIETRLSAGTHKSAMCVITRQM